MKALVIATSVEKGLWLAELTHPYWHLSERHVEIDIASPKGGELTWFHLSDPYDPESEEADDLVSKGFLCDQTMRAKLNTTLRLADIDPASYDAVHIAGGAGAAVDLYPNPDMTRILEHFFATGKVVGAICHGSIALANVPERIRSRHLTGFSLEEDMEVEKQIGKKNFIPHYPQPTLEESGAIFTCVPADGLHVVSDGKLVTGQNQWSASDYGLQLYHVLSESNPLVIV